jgi:hypothetical protein
MALLSAKAKVTKSAEMEQLLKDLGEMDEIKESEIIARTTASTTTMIHLPEAMTRRSQREGKRKGKSKSTLFTTDGVYFFSSKKLVDLHERTKNNQKLQQMLVKRSHVSDRDMFYFKQSWDDYDEKYNFLAKLLRDAQNSRTALTCSCGNDRKVKHFHAKAHRAKRTKEREMDRQEEYEKEIKQSLEDAKKLQKEGKEKDVGDGEEKKNSRDPESSVEESLVRLRTERDNAGKSVLHYPFMDVSVGVYDYLRIKYLLFILSLDDVTQKSIDMEVEMLMEQERIKQEKEMSYLAFQSVDTAPHGLGASKENAEGTDSSEGESSDTEADPFEDSDEYPSSTEEDTSSEEEEEKEGEDDSDGEAKRKKKKKKKVLTIDRDSMVVTPSMCVNFNVLWWLFYTLEQMPSKPLGKEGEGIFTDLTGSEGQLCIAASLCAGFEYTIGYEDNIESHELACRLEEFSSHRSRKMKKQRKLDGYGRGDYDVEKLTKEHCWLEKEWCSKRVVLKPEDDLSDSEESEEEKIMDDAEQDFWIHYEEDPGAGGGGTKPEFAPSTVVFIDTTKIKPKGFKQMRGRRKKRLPKKLAEQRIIRFFRSITWYLKIWKDRMNKKMAELIHQMDWLRQGSVIVVVTPTMLPGPNWLNNLRLSDCDPDSWEGPIKHVNALDESIKEEWLHLNGRSLYKDGDKMDFHIYRKKTHSPYF